MYIYYASESDWTEPKNLADEGFDKQKKVPIFARQFKRKKSLCQRFSNL